MSMQPKPVHDPLDLLLIATAAMPVPSAATARTVSTTGEATEVVQTAGGVTGKGSGGGLWTKIQEQPVPGTSARATAKRTTGRRGLIRPSERRWTRDRDRSRREV